MKYSFISCDDHIIEPADCYTSRLPAGLRKDAPYVANVDGSDTWIVKGRPVTPVVKNSALIDVPADKRAQERKNPATYETVRPGIWKTRPRLEDYDSAGVYAAVLFPDFLPGFTGNPYWSFGDHYEVRLACVRAYNDWLIGEFCSEDPDRYIALCLIPNWSVQESVNEVERAAKMGFRGVVAGGIADVFGYPWLGDPRWDPLWGAIQDSGIVLTFHQQSGLLDRPTMPPESSFPGAILARATRPALAGMQQVADLLASGILERFPRLKVLVAECGATWLPFILQGLDRKMQHVNPWAGTHLRMKPSECSRRQVHVGFWWEKIDPSVVEICGEDNLMWEQDYPHPLSVWPQTAESVDYCLEPIKDERIKRKLRFENCARLFNLEVTL